MEIIHFQDVIATGAGTWVLSTLLRGRRGTEGAAEAGHAAGAPFLLLTAGALYRLPLSLGELGQQRYWRAVSLGQLFEQARRHAFTVQGRDLMPYRPVHLRGSRAGDDLVISWIRRTRLGGEWRGGTGSVPLAETSEAYEVDILNGSQVVRTLTTSTPQVLYPAAQQTTDFGSPQASITVRVYQLNQVFADLTGVIDGCLAGLGSSSPLTPSISPPQPPSLGRARLRKLRRSDIT